MNYCSKCGNIVEEGELFCKKCGNPLSVNQNNDCIPSVQPVEHTQNQQSTSQQTTESVQSVYNQNDFNPNPLQNDYKKKSVKKEYIIGGIIGLVVLFILFGCIALFNSNNGFYFSSESYNDSGLDADENATKSNKNSYGTSIVYDNIYSGISIDSSSAAVKLIQQDSVTQKTNCPKEIVEIENRIIKNYEVDAVNLCEMDVDFALEVENVIKLLYQEFPNARGVLTNISLANVPLTQGYIAAFMPIFTFATSSTSDSYPWVIKTEILLNSSYFLDTERMEASVKDGSASGHFPKNATRYSPVAHEFAHYFSYIAMMNSYGMDSMLLIDKNNLDEFYEVYTDFGEGNFSLKMINEAYQNYKTKTNTDMTILKFRESISGYAVAKDANGEFIYDETIAEAFHDYYLNGQNASDASKEIVAVLKKHLESVGE